MFSYKCTVCEGDCDPGELEGGICYECRSNIQDERNSRNRDELNSHAIMEINKKIRARYVLQPDGKVAAGGS